MNMKWIAAAMLVIAVAAGVFAVLRDRAADAAAAQAASLAAEAQKARADLKSAQAERDASRKETAELRAAAQQLRSDADVAKQFLEAEKAVSARLREDLAMASARLAAAGARQQRASDAIPPAVLRGLAPINQPPPAVRAAPYGGAAAGAAVPAR